jgi:predicted nucleotidyltransferase
MIQKEIINKVKSIILTHVKPKRIYIYGSQISGESEKTSDIDIAFDDEEFKDMSIIEDEIKQLNTLAKDIVKLSIWQIKNCGLRTV